MKALESADKSRRQRAIQDLVEHEVIASQDDLSRQLKRCGFRVTQATLSRDLRDLRIMRVPTDSGYRYAPADGNGHAAGGGAAEGRLRSLAAMEVTSVESNETAVVVRTLTGRAQGVAVHLDAMRLPDVLATVAGDDTILVLPRSVKRTARLKAVLAQALGIA